MGRDYFLGLDMGTGSLGWAVTDSEYKILKKYGINLTLKGRCGRITV